MDQIPAVDWNELGFPMMPTWIRNLASGDADLRKQTLDSLYDSRITEITTATLYVIPCLIELLKDENVQGKEDILNLLTLLADEASSIGDDDISRLVLNRIEEAYELYFSFLEKPKTSSVTFDLLGYLHGQFDQIAPRLLLMLKQAEIKAPLAYTMYHLLESKHLSNPDRETYIANFTSLLSSTETDYVRLAAAMVLSLLLQENAPNQVDSILGNALSSVKTEKRAYASSFNALSKAVIHLGTERAVNVLVSVVTQENDFVVSMRILPLLLNLGFNDGNTVRFSETFHKTGDNVLREIDFSLYPEEKLSRSSIYSLNPLQRQIISALLNNSAIWSVKTNIFELHGLPSSKDGLRKLLD